MYDTPSWTLQSWIHRGVHQALEIKLLQDRRPVRPVRPVMLNFRDQYGFPSKNTPKLLSHLAKYVIFFLFPEKLVP